MCLSMKSFKKWNKRFLISNKNSPFLNIISKKIILEPRMSKKSLWSSKTRMDNCRRKISKISKFLILKIAKQLEQVKSKAWKEQIGPNLSMSISGICFSLLKYESKSKWYWLIYKQNLMKLWFYSQHRIHICS